MAEQNHNRDMTDQSDRQDLEDRVDQLEQTISKMLPSRRDALKLGGAALVGGAAMSGAASAQPGDQDGEAGVIGTDNNPVDIEASDIEVDDLVVNNTATGVTEDVQGARVSLSSDQSIGALNRTKIEFDNAVYDSDNNFDFTNNHFNCPQTGLYFANLQVFFEGGGSGESRDVGIDSSSGFGSTGKGGFFGTKLDNEDRVQVSTVNKYSQGETIAGYASNRDSNDIIGSGNLVFSTFLEVAFLGSL
jgi:hypothetical protein